MNRILKAFVWTAVFGLIILISVGSVSSQKRSTGRTVASLWEDTAINPHDYTNEYYEMMGINTKGIIDRRTGADGLSVISNSSNPFHTNVRVTVTLPAYDQHGDLLFWYPLGELQDFGLTDDRLVELARNFPIYVFPKTAIVDYRTFSSVRQAALMDNSFSMTNTEDSNPLGIREIRFVNYTEKAFGPEGIEMLAYFRKKNGASADDTPIIRTLDDLQMLLKNEMISADPAGNGISGGRYAINPIIFDPRNGVIAKDAFIWMATKEEKPLPSEDMFVWQFYCLQKTGNWCP